jgi:hypothetical protein
MAKHSKARSGSTGRLSYQPSPDEGLVPKTLEFVRNQLPAWRNDPKRPAHPSEKRLNSSLCNFLNNRVRSGCPMVRFEHETPQAGSRTVDIGIHGMEEITSLGAGDYTLYQPFMVIEAKRLPAPSKDREREYVTGTNKSSGGPTGGIQRFKLGLHGADTQTALIVGYIEEQSVQHWFATINRWIAELVAKTISDGCIWSKADGLDQLVWNEEQNTSIAVSMHQRSGACLTPEVRIHHLWVVMPSAMP